jgi:hypothetical protein
VQLIHGMTLSSCTPLRLHPGLRLLLLVVCSWTPAATAGARQTPGPTSGPASGFGASCVSGQYAIGGYLLVCSKTNTFRYALPDDIPPAPPEGYVVRPAWYPKLSEVYGSLTGPKCPLAGRVTFTSPIVRLEDLTITEPQGLMVGDHVTPIDHGYIGVKPLATPLDARTDADYVPIYAPADGQVIEISLLGSPTSIRVVMAHGCETYSTYMVLNRLSGALGSLQQELLAKGRLAPGIQLLAGQEFGEQRDNPLDFSVQDGATWLSGFVAPFSYAEGEAWKPYTVDPWPYFAPDLDAAYQASLQRIMSPRWGRIDQDLAGTASGNWFLAGTVGYSGRSLETFRSATTSLAGGNVEGKNAYAWSHLAIARHTVQPAAWIFSIGWWKDERGDSGQWLIEVRPGQPDPSALTPDWGMVVYRLQRIGTTVSQPPESRAPMPINYDVVPWATEGLVALQVNSDGTLTVEPRPGAQDPDGFRAFSSAQRTYRR